MTITKILEVIIAAGLLNVWIFRFKQASPYRGNSAQNMKEEFVAYGLPEQSAYAVGALKIAAALLLIVGIWIPAVVAPAASVICLLMIGAIAMHVKIKDPILKSVPAIAMLGLNLALLSQIHF
jgi:hypothetical protein